MLDMLGVSGPVYNDERHKLRASPLWAATSSAAKARI